MKIIVSRSPTEIIFLLGVCVTAKGHEGWNIPRSSIAEDSQFVAKKNKGKKKTPKATAGGAVPGLPRLSADLPNCLTHTQTQIQVPSALLVSPPAASPFPRARHTQATTDADVKQTLIVRTLETNRQNRHVSWTLYVLCDILSRLMWHWYSAPTSAEVVIFLLARHQRALCVCMHIYYYCLFPPFLPGFCRTFS